MCNVLFREPSQKTEVGKKKTSRPKEQVTFVKNAQARSCTLYKRKATLFSKGLKLHAMTKSEVLIIVDQPNGQRFVCGSDIILDKYNKGTLRPTETDKKYDGSNTTSPEESDVPGILPLVNTPDKIDLDESLASVLGHERAIVPTRRRRLPFRNPSEPVLPSPVRELLLNRPTPQLNDKEKEEVPLIQRQSKITFISDDDVECFAGQDSS